MRSKSEIQSAIRKAEATIAKSEEEVKKLNVRKEAVEAKLAGLPAENALRADRQAALVRGETVDRLTNEIAKTRDLAELYGDEIAGLEQVIAGKNQVIEGARAELQPLAVELALSDGGALIREYNTKAKELSEVLRKIHQQQLAYFSVGGRGEIFQTALYCTLPKIPRFFLKDEEIPAESTLQVFWDINNENMSMV